MALGRLLDTLIVKVLGDITDFRDKMREAANITEGLGRHVHDTLGRQFALGDVIQAGLVAPMVAASTVIAAQSARIVRDMTAARNAVVGASATAGVIGTRRGPGGVFEPDDATLAGGSTGLMMLGAGGTDDDVRARRAEARAERRLAEQRAQEARTGRPDGRGGLRPLTAVETLRQSAGDAARGVRDLAGGLGRGVRDLGLWVAGLFGLRGLLGGLGDLLKPLAGFFTGIGRAITGLLGPWGLLIAAVTALLGLFAATHWDKFRTFIDWVSGQGVAAWEHFTNAIDEGVKDLVAAFKELGQVLFGGEGGTSFASVFISTMQVLVHVATAAFKSIGDIIGSTLKIIADVIRAFAALISGNWEALWANLLKIVTDAIGAIVQVIDNFLPGFKETWESFWTGVGEFFGGVWDGIKDKFGGVIAWIEERWRGFMQFIGVEMSEDQRLALRVLGGDAEAAAELQRRSQTKSGSKGGATGGKPNAAGVYDAKLKDTQIIDENARYGAELFASHFESALKGMLRGQRVTFRDFMYGLLLDIGDALIEQISSSIVQLFGGAGGKGSGGGGLFGMLGSLLSGGAFGGPNIGWHGAPNPGGGMSLGGSFGGFFADGGYLQPGKWGIAGEKGAERIYGGRNGLSVIPGGGGLSVHSPITIHAPGADAAQLRRVEHEVRQLRAELPARIAAKVGDMKSRGRLNYG